MVTDARYTDNVVLKRAAYQELLTGIKHYPVVDIDYMEEWDTDDRTNRQIWSGYTEDSPCIKITYGDPQTTKGNIIFSTKFRKAINDLKREIEALENAISKKEDYLDRLRKIYNDNNNTLLKETRQIQAYEAEQLELADKDADEVRQLLTDRTSGIIQMVAAVAHANPQTAEQFEGFNEYTIQDINFTEGFFELKGTSWSTVILSTDEPRSFVYKPEKFNDIPVGSPYYIYDPETNLWTTQEMTDALEPSDRYVFTQVTRDELEEKKNERLYLKIYHDFDAIRATVAIPLYRMAYSKYIKAGLSDPNHIPDPARQEDLILQFYNMVVEFINLLEAYETNWGYYQTFNDTTYSIDLDSLQLGAKFQAMSDTVLNYLNSIFIAELKSKIDVTAEHYNVHYGDQNGADLTSSDGTTVRYRESLLGLKARIVEAQEEIAQYQEWIEKVAEGTAIVNNDGTGIIESDAGIDRRMFGYKYIKVGQLVSFQNTYYRNSSPWYVASTLKEGMSTLEVTDTADNQASGTFRITLNNEHTYEVPIKGFTNTQSNKPIYIKTSSSITETAGTSITETAGTSISETAGTTITIHSKGNTTIRAKNDSNTLQTITLDGNLVTNGTSNLIGNVTTGTGDGGSNIIPGKTHTGSIGDSTHYWNYGYFDNLKVGTSNGGNILPNTTEVSDLGSASLKWKNIYGVTGYFDTLLPSDSSDDKTETSIGSDGQRWTYIYGYTGDFTILKVNGNEIDASRLNNAINGGSNGQIWTSNGSGGAWSNNISITGTIHTTNTANAVTPDSTTASSYSENSAASINTSGGVYAAKDIWGRRIFNAVFNDYAECRTTINLEPGRVVIDNDDGSLSCASQRLQPGAQVISDTFGHCMGKTSTAKTPLAVAGRVLVYTYQPRENYHAGMAVCSAPNGTADIMSREEIKNYPDCIIGIVSEIPQYEQWGTDNIKVNGRIWIKIK